MFLGLLSAAVIIGAALLIDRSSIRFFEVISGWTNYFLSPLAPIIIFILYVTLPAILAVPAINQCSKKIAEQLRENYGIIVEPYACRRACDYDYRFHPAPLIDAKDLETGNSMIITLRFSDDHKSVTPFVVGAPAAIAPLKLDLKR